MVAYKVSIRCNDSEVISVEQSRTEVIFLSTLSFPMHFSPKCILIKGEVEVSFSSGRVVVSSDEEQTVVRKSRGVGGGGGEGGGGVVEDELEWRRLDGRLKRVPKSSTRGEKVHLLIIGRWSNDPITCRWWWRAWASRPPGWRSGAWARLWWSRWWTSPHNFVDLLLSSQTSLLFCSCRLWRRAAACCATPAPSAATAPTATLRRKKSLSTRSWRRSPRRRRASRQPSVEKMMINVFVIKEIHIFCGYLLHLRWKCRVWVWETPNVLFWVYLNVHKKFALIGVVRNWFPSWGTIS